MAVTIIRHCDDCDRVITAGYWFTLIEDNMLPHVEPLHFCDKHCLKHWISRNLD